jgi:signal transduction histidine kinase/ActR/RegA family two-component response regulator
MNPETPASDRPAHPAAAGEHRPRAAGPHSLLRRQLRRHVGDLDAVPEAWRAFVEAVNDAYLQSDRDRVMLERSVALSSEELLQANAGMRAAVKLLQQAQLELESRVADRTRELTVANDTLRQAAADQRHLEAQLRQAQKMEAIGLLAGGVAHDFNNLLTVIVGQLDFLSEGRMDGGSQESVREIRQAVDSAASLTHQLLAFSRQQALTPKLVDVNALVGDTALLLRRLIGEDIELAIDLAPEAGTVRADTGQLQQVLLNLGVNARDAMPDGGRLSIATSSATFDARSPVGEFPIKHGTYAVIAVTDTGIGMDATIRARIFEPFFTTKALHHGTGLGLATAYGIVKQSEGYIDVTSEPGLGSRFRVLLPKVAVAPDRPERAEAKSAAGAGSILVVEDQEAVRRVICSRLRAAGYVVHEASSGPDALELAPTLPGIDVLLTDVIMPHMNGFTLASRLLDERPDLKVLYMTGHIGNMGMARDPRDGGRPVLQKPFPAGTLLAALRSVLEAP